MEKNKLYYEVDVEKNGFDSNLKGESNFVKNDEYEDISDYAFDELIEMARQYDRDDNILSFKVEVGFLDEEGNEIKLTTNDKQYKRY